LEVHGEWARFSDAPRAVLAGTHAAGADPHLHSALIGLRYLTERDTTIIVELYRNGGGYSSDELRAFYDLVRASPGSPALTLAGRPRRSAGLQPAEARRGAMPTCA
jgi:hypothetical protein